MDAEQHDITLPLEIIDGRFTLEQIGTISVLMGIPLMPSDKIQKWGDNQKFMDVISGFVKDKIAVPVPEGDGIKLEFDLT